MKFKFENNTLYLPIVEAKNIREGEITPLLFEIAPCFIEGTQHMFDFNQSEPNYPSIITDKEKSKFAEKFNLDSQACQNNDNGRTVSYQLAIFWHFLGDGTHHSEFVKTPFGFYPGYQITIENLYNVKPTSAFIKNIKLTRFDETKWFWLVEIERL